MSIKPSDEERELTERNIKSLSALFAQMGGNVPQFIKHVSESMAMSTVAIREANRLRLEEARERRAEERAARRASDHS